MRTIRRNILVVALVFLGMPSVFADAEKKVGLDDFCVTASVEQTTCSILAPIIVKAEVSYFGKTPNMQIYSLPPEGIRVKITPLGAGAKVTPEKWERLALEGEKQGEVYFYGDFNVSDRVFVYMAPGVTEVEAKKYLTDSWASQERWPQEVGAALLDRAAFGQTRTVLLTLQDYIKIEAPGRYRVELFQGVREPKNNNIKAFKSNPLDITVTE